MFCLTLFTLVLFRMKSHLKLVYFDDLLWLNHFTPEIFFYNKAWSTNQVFTNTLHNLKSLNFTFVKLQHLDMAANGLRFDRAHHLLVPNNHSLLR